MLSKHKKRKSEMASQSNNLVGILLSNGIGLLFVIIFTLIASLVLTNSANLSNMSSILFVAIILFGAFITGFVASKKCNFKGIISGIISSIPYIFIITFLMLIFSNGRLNIYTSICYLFIFIFSTIGGIVSANTKRRK